MLGPLHVADFDTLAPDSVRARSPLANGPLTERRPIGRSEARTGPMAPITAADAPRRREADGDAFGRAALHCFALAAELDWSVDTASARGLAGERVVFVNRCTLSASSLREGDAPRPSNDSGFLLMKLDPSGVPAWTKRFPGAIRLEGIAVDSSGAILLTGMLLGSASLGGAPLQSVGADAFVAKLDASGRHVWSCRFGDSYSQGRGVAVDREGNVTVTGVFFGNIDFGAGPLAAGGALSMFVAQLDSSGGALWSKRFRGAGLTMGLGITARESGRLSLSALCDGPVDFGGGPVTVRDGSAIVNVDLDSAGGHVSSRRVGALHSRFR